MWINLFEVMGIDMPKYSVPKLEAKPILTNDEALQLTFKPKIIHKREPSAVSSVGGGEERYTVS